MNSMVVEGIILFFLRIKVSFRCDMIEVEVRGVDSS